MIASLFSRRCESYIINSLDDSHIQTYVMNNVEIVIDYYLHIISHIFHVVTSCTHYTSYSLLNLVHEIECEVGLAIQDYMFLDFDTKHVYWLSFVDKKCKNLVFGRSWLNSNVFWKTFKLIIMHFIHEINWFEWFPHKTSFVFQKFQFSRFSIDRIYFLIDKKCIKNFGLNLPDSIGARSIESIFWSIKPQFQPIEIWKFSLLKCFSLTCSLLFQKLFRLSLSLSLSLSLFDRSNLSDFCRFLPQISLGFLSSSIGKTFIPFLFQFNCMFHAFSCIFLEIFEHRNLGIFVHFNCF